MMLSFFVAMLVSTLQVFVFGLAVGLGFGFGLWCRHDGPRHQGWPSSSSGLPQPRASFVVFDSYVRSTPTSRRTLLRSSQFSCRSATDDCSRGSVRPAFPARSFGDYPKNIYNVVLITAVSETLESLAARTFGVSHLKSCMKLGS